MTIVVYDILFFCKPRLFLLMLCIFVKSKTLKHTWYILC